MVLAAGLTCRPVTCGVAVAGSGTPNAGDVYVANQGANSVSVIDPITNKIVDTINVGAQPTEVAVVPKGAENAGDVYVLNKGVGSDSAPSVTVIGTNNTVTETITSGYLNPNTTESLTVNSVNGDAYIANGDNVAVVDAGTGTVSEVALPTGTTVSDVVAGLPGTSGSGDVYAFGSTVGATDTSLYTIGSGNQVVSTLNLNSGTTNPNSLDITDAAIDPANSQEAYVISGGLDGVTEVDLATGAVGTPAGLGTSFYDPGAESIAAANFIPPIP